MLCKNAFNLDQSKTWSLGRVDSLPNNKILDWSKLKPFTNTVSLTKMTVTIFKCKVNLVEKGEK